MIKLLIVSLFLTSFQVGAKRYKVPQDDQVLTYINQNSSEENLYPFNIKVLVWNIYKGQKKSWKKDFKFLGSEKDLILLQEGLLNKNMMDTLIVDQGVNYIFATSWIDTKYNQNSGVLTGSRSFASGSLWQRSRYREPVLKTPKMTLFTKYKLAGVESELLVGNIHAINFVRAYKLRDMLDEAAKIIKSHKGPVLFAGDFNTWTQTKLNNMNAVFKKLGMKSIKFKNDIRKKFLGKILDHAWVRGLDVQLAEIPNINGSDHPPMVIELSVY